MVHLKTQSTAELAAFARAGDHNALEALIARLEPMVRKIARATIGFGPWLAEEAAQEALIDIVGAIANLEDPEAVVPWTRTIAARAAVAAAKRESEHEKVALDPELIGSELSIDGLLLAAAFGELPPRQRAVAGLRLLIGLSEAETAETLGISIGTAKFHLHAARKRLQAEIR
jgi:RNA polymerase sigma-70 factor (ECF subfamily)